YCHLPLGEGARLGGRRSGWPASPAALDGRACKSSCGTARPVGAGASGNRSTRGYNCAKHADTLRSRMRHLLVLCLSLSCTPLLAADVAGSEDLQSLPRFPRAQIVDFLDQPVVEKRYPQDSLRRISGQLRAVEVLAEGRLRALTYRLPDEHSP